MIKFLSCVSEKNLCKTGIEFQKILILQDEKESQSIGGVVKIKDIWVWVEDWRRNVAVNHSMSVTR